jgi:Amt family ammonium transporter
MAYNNTSVLSELTHIATLTCEIDKADTVWVGIASLLVMLMIPSVGLIYAGLVQNSSISSTLGLCLTILSMTTVQWCLIGYSLVFGESQGGFIGNLKYLALNTLDNFQNKCYNVDYDYNKCLEKKNYWESCGIPELLFFFFQSKFAGITSVIIIGSFSERMYLKYSLLFVFIWNIMVYCPVGHWVWNADGFMSVWGVRDFAGGLVIHIATGFTALSASLFLGKRKHYSTMPEVTNFPFFIFGTLLLWFGWFGFNGGSSNAIDKVGIFAIINTNIAASMSLIVWVLIDLLVYKKISSSGICMGVVCGLVAITPAAGYIPLNMSFFTGFIAGLICWIVVFLKKKYKLFDDLEIFACHGVAGLVGAIICGFFANKGVDPYLPYNGLAYVQGDESKIFILLQFLGFIIIASYSSIVTFVILYVINKLFTIKPKTEEEVYYDQINFFDENLSRLQAHKLQVVR